MAAFFILTFLTGLLFLGGTGGCGNNTPAEEPPPVAEKGVFVDAPVQGLSFETETQAGVTDANGAFLFFPDENIRFFLGDIEFGESAVGDLLSPFDLAGISPITDARELRTAYNKMRNEISQPFSRVINTALVLQSLDADQDPSNGIVLPEGLADSAEGKSIHFDNPDVLSGFHSDPGFRSLIRDGRAAGLWTNGPFEGTQAAAMTHLYETLGKNPVIFREKTAFNDGDVNGTDDARGDFFYNEAGQFSRFEQDENLDGTPDSTYGNTYDDAGRLIRFEGDFNADGNLDSVTELFYDEFGQEIRSEQDNDGDGSLDFIQTREFDPLGNVTRVLLDTDGNGTTDETRNLSYDENNKQILEEDDNDADGIIDSVTRQFYDANLNNIRSEMDSNNDGTVDDVTTTVFNEDNRFVRSERDTNNDGSADSISTAQHDEAGRVIRSESDTNADGHVDFSVSIGYDELGNRTRFEVDSDGDAQPNSIQTYEIDEFGYTLVEESDNNADGTIDNRSHFEYEPGTWFDFFAEES